MRVADTGNAVQGQCTLAATEARLERCAQCAIGTRHVAADSRQRAAERAMNIEIERKFLVVGDAWKKQGTPVTIRQGYLSSQPDRVVRVRIEGESGTLTIKGRVEGISRGEWEYAIPLDEANALLNGLCERPLIEKTRTRIVHAGLTWEVDEIGRAHV